VGCFGLTEPNAGSGTDLGNKGIKADLSGK